MSFLDSLSNLSTGQDLAIGATVGGGLLGAAGSLLAGNATAKADQASANGYAQEANLYNTAAEQAGYNVGSEQAGGALATAQVARQVELARGEATADLGFGNLSIS